MYFNVDLSIQELTSLTDSIIQYIIPRDVGVFLADKAKSILVKLKSCKFILKFKILIKRHNHLPLEYNKPQKIPMLPTWL